MNDGLVPVDIDLIRSLRLGGKWLEAESLVRSFRNSCVRSKLQENREITNRLLAKKVARGFCAWSGCFESNKVSGYYCYFHKEKKRLYDLKRKEVSV